MEADYNLQPLIHQLAVWSRLLAEKLIVAQLVKKFPAFYEVRKVITVFTTAGHKTLSGA
jgi:hypothetical protein